MILLGPVVIPRVRLLLVGISRDAFCSASSLVVILRARLSELGTGTQTRDACWTIVMSSVRALCVLLILRSNSCLCGSG